MQSLPPHLQKYIVEQNYEKYTPVDQACWRYILRQLRAFLSVHAHECYLEGLEKTGISVERIPKISEVSEKLEAFGWRALPVSGFIPPAAFMELQSLSVLPIASDMRTLEHLSYTPAPDIVHEAAGHAPILIHPEFAAYLKKYAEVAKKAIISKEDLAVYEAIRELSDLKENPGSTTQQIDEAQKNLDLVSRSVTHISEAAELSRMNWWTAEYGLIGDLKNPKIFGAGLLSSVGESKWCLSDKVRKIPLSVECIRQTYDITEPQPQLYVAANFQNLSSVLDDMSKLMAYQVGGTYGLDKAIQAQSVNTFQLDSGLQISGQITGYKTDSRGEIAYVQTTGPSQISWRDKELPQHGRATHAHGFGTAVGLLQDQTLPLASMSERELQSLELVVKNDVSLNFSSGVRVQGHVQSLTFIENTLVLISFTTCTVTHQGTVLFDPSWGTYDMAVGQKVTSVFGGPADRISYGGFEDFVAKKVPSAQFNSTEKQRHLLFHKIRQYRERIDSGFELIELFSEARSQFPSDWLMFLEIYEICVLDSTKGQLGQVVKDHLHRLQSSADLQGLIQNGLDLLTESPKS